MRSSTKNKTLIFFYIIQFIIFSLSVFLFTSTIKAFPWYEPLTMGTFMLLLIITPLQVLMLFISWNLYKDSLIRNHSNLLTAINSGVLVVAIFIGISSVDLFYTFAQVCAITECILALLYIVTILRT